MVFLLSYYLMLQMTTLQCDFDTFSVEKNYGTCAGGCGLKDLFIGGVFTRTYTNKRSNIKYHNFIKHIYFSHMGVQKESIVFSCFSNCQVNAAIEP